MDTPDWLVLQQRVVIGPDGEPDFSELSDDELRALDAVLSRIVAPSKHAAESMH